MLPEGYSCFAACACEVAEGPRWNQKEETLYWVDIPRGVVYRKKYPDGTIESFSPGIGKIGALTFYGEKLLLFGAQCKVYLCSFGDFPQLFAELSACNDTRFNDVFDDGSGHLFCGVAWNPEKRRMGELWQLNLHEKRFTMLECGLTGMPNGMALSPDRKTFYFAVTEEYRIYCYDYDEKAGKISRRRCFAELPHTGGAPDGIACDSQGNLAVALWGGGSLLHFSSDGLMRKVEPFPMKLVTSVAFAPCGCFVTTGNRPYAETAFHEVGAGSVFLKLYDSQKT